MERSILPLWLLGSICLGRVIGRAVSRRTDSALARGAVPAALGIVQACLGAWAFDHFRELLVGAEHASADRGNQVLVLVIVLAAGMGFIGGLFGILAPPDRELNEESQGPGKGQDAGFHSLIIEDDYNKKIDKDPSAKKDQYNSIFDWSSLEK